MRTADGWMSEGGFGGRPMVVVLGQEGGGAGAAGGGVGGGAALPDSAPVAGDESVPLEGGAQDPGNANPGNANQSAPPGLGGEFIFILLGFMLLMILMSTMAGRKEKKRRAAMLASVGRNDRVLMGGGIVGVVTDLRDDELVVRVDEATNTRITFTKNSLQQVVKSASGE